MMDGFLAFVGLMIWLAAGGWAFADISDWGKNAIGAVIFCMVLGPFAFGSALAKRFHTPNGERDE
jgi:hypothetical protein